MFGSTHLLVGATVATYTGNYFFGGVAAFLSHLVVDVIPHYDFPPPNFNSPKPMILQMAGPILETLGGFILLYICFLLNPHLSGGLLILGGFLGLFLDLWHHFPYWREFTRKITPTFFKIHEDVQNEELLPHLAGRLMNLPVIIIAIWFLLSY